MNRTASRLNALNYTNPVFFDLETSGLNSGRHQIIQIAAAAPSSGEEFEVKLRFRRGDASREALESNCYDPEIWKREAVPQKDGLMAFADFLNRHRSIEKLSKRQNVYRVAVLAGYRIDRFDTPFLIDQFTHQGIFCPFELRVYDVFQLALWMLPGLDDYTLAGVAAHLGINTKGAHHALRDVEMTIAICRILLQEVFEASSLPGWARLDL